MRRMAFALALGAMLATPALAASSRHYDVHEYTLGPHRVTLMRGTRVTWTWSGLKHHSVTSSSGPARFSSPIQVHGSFGHTFKRPGVYHLYCQVHPQQMQMTVVVR